MKKIIFCIFVLLFPIIAKADCTAEEISRLKTLATKISVTYEYEEKSHTFSITFHNVHKDLKLVNMWKTYSSKEEMADITINNLFPGYTYSVEIISNYKNCKGKNITTKYYTTPYYNYYYNDPLCEGNETKNVCQKWVDTSSLSYEDFTNSFKQKETEEIQIEEEKNTYSILSDLFVKYYYVLFGSIIIICMTIIIVKSRKDRFNF